MFLYLSKILPLLVYPPGLTLLFCIAAFIIRKRRPRLAGGLFLFAMVSLYLLSTEAIADWTIGSLESKYPALSIGEVPAADAIVVLGGYLHSPNLRRKDAEWEEGIDRLWMGARLFRAGKAPVVLLTGGHVSLFGSSIASEAASAKQLLHEWGIPDEAILEEGRSQNTRENATFSKAILDARGAKRLLLVTSAFHMPRAMAIFRRSGMDVTPVPTDYQSGWDDPDFPLAWLPDAEHLTHSKLALKEWLGLFVYRLRGWA